MKLYSKNYSVYLIIFFMILAIVDIIREYSAGESLTHLTFEVVIFLCASAWTIILWYSWLTARKDLDEAKAEKMKLTAGFQVVITKQFEKWELTPAEANVAFLLLKGLPFKEIADIRGGSEKTIRHHAMKIYQKSGMQGRTELFAYFFEDLFSI